jgi:RNA polymerase sigma-70 factor, ECF subfamily
MAAGRRFPDGIQDQMQRVFVAHAEAVFGSAFIAAHGDRMLAEEATMDAFVEAAQTTWTAFLTWDDGRQLAWLRHRAKNRVIDSWRKNRNMTVTDSLPEVAEVALVEDVVLSRAVVDRCWKVIRSMEPRRHRAAYLCWHEGRSITEAASILGVDRATASRDLAAVASRLRRELGAELRLPEMQATGDSGESQEGREEGS